MGWAWRSSESYGDKDEPVKPESSAESRGAEQPAADAGFRRSLWEDDYDDWRGYRGPVYEGYSSDKAIDDSDDRWYRKSSFHYSSYRDYSPSSLFRSAFYSPRSSYYGEDNDIKNRAIRALRTLTRNANTVCNRDAKISYAVQYSSGADTNTCEESLIDGKKSKTIYVSPDAIVDATTTEDEDAAIDVLTGFVLLRVQIAQEFNERTIDKINALTMRSLPKKLISLIGKAHAGDGSKIASKHIDECLAGMLAKGLLTRLARRGIVKDWGGFAPYLVRHAKKFVSVREKLDQTELSVESLLGKIAYNMVDDENQFALEPEVEAIVTKHLGNELAPDLILPACHELIAELRKYVEEHSPTPAGPIEQQLSDILGDMAKEHAERMAEHEQNASAARQGLEEFASELTKCAEASRAGNEKLTYVREGNNSLTEEINKLFAEDQMIGNLKTDAEALEAMANRLAEIPLGDPSRLPVEQNAQYLQETIAARLKHFRAQLEELKRAGCTKEIKPEDYKAATPAELEKKVRDESAALKDFSEDAFKVIKEKLAELRKKIVDHIEHVNAEIIEQKRLAHEASEQMGETAKRLTELCKDAGSELVNTEIPKSAAVLQRFMESQEAVVEPFTDAAETIKNSRSMRTLRTEFTRFVRRCVEKPMNPHYELQSPYGWVNSHDTMPMTTFAHEANKAMRRADSRAASSGDSWKNELAALGWEAAAIENFLKQLNENTEGFENAAIDAANSELFAQLEKLFTNADGDINVPGHVGHIEDDDIKRTLKRLAESAGMTSQQLLEVHTALDNNHAGQDPEMVAAGKAVGERIRNLLPLFEQINSADEHLFGMPIPVQTKLLADEAINQVNDEARNDPEEEYVAYLSHNQAKPKVRVERSKPNAQARLLAKEVRNRSRGAIARIREALQFQNGKRIGEVFGVRSGDLDEGGLHKLGYDCEHIWSQKTIAKLPDVAVGILVDQSGSMCSALKISQAREMCIALAEAVKKIPGVHLHIYGHTANMSNMSDLLLFEHYSSTSDTAGHAADLDTLGTIDGHSNNYDGYAIKETAKLLAKDPAKRKYLFVIADGLPHGEGYGGPEARKHVTSVCQFVRERLKIATYAFAVGVHPSSQHEFIEQYGKNHVMFLTTVSKCLPQIVRFLRNSLQREKALVEVSA